MSKTIQDMAREAGFQTGTRDYANGGGSYPVVLPLGYNTCLSELEAFAKLVREEHCKAIIKMIPDDFDGIDPQWLREAIQSRSTK